jgi:hypothetical protein
MESSQEPFGFVDDFDPPNNEEVACFDSPGSRAGNQCCWSVGACCDEENWNVSRLRRITVVHSNGTTEATTPSATVLPGCSAQRSHGPGA